MIASYKRKANIAAGMFLISVLLGRATLVPAGSSGVADTAVQPLVEIIGGASLLAASLWYLKAKGRSLTWLLLLGPLLVLFLEDRCKDGAPPQPDPTKRSGWASDL
jgi:hypothetical protein